MADYELDDEAHEYCRRLIDRYPEFDFIDSSEVLVVVNTTATQSHYYAQTSLIPKYLWPVLDYRILIKTNQCNYSLLPDNTKILIMDHELKHIIPGEPYKLVRHDVEDFSSMLREYGVQWALRNDLPNLLS